MTQADLDQDLGEDFQAFDKENIISESFVEQDLYDYYDTHRASNRTNYVDHNALWMPQKNNFDSRTPLRTRSMRPYSTTTSKPIPASGDRSPTSPAASTRYEELIRNSVFLRMFHASLQSIGTYSYTDAFKRYIVSGMRNSDSFYGVHFGENSSTERRKIREHKTRFRKEMQAEEWRLVAKAVKKMQLSAIPAVLTKFHKLLRSIYDVPNSAAGSASSSPQACGLLHQALMKSQSPSMSSAALADHRKISLRTALYYYIMIQYDNYQSIWSGELPLQSKLIEAIEQFNQSESMIDPIILASLLDSIELLDKTL
jgi:hypothetical protein